jgi:sugar phosphate isomerase/epimerase
MPGKSYQLAFQLYTARNFPPLEPVLEGLAEIGYDAVEAWAPDFADPKGFRRRLDDAGLTCMGFHLPFRGLVEHPQKYIDIAHTIGDRPLMIPPYLTQEQRPSDADGWRRIGEQLAEGARKAKAEGLTVAWHNHEFEYRHIAEGVRPIDLMLEAAGDDVGMEVDFAWVLRGWADPLAELKRYGSRMVSIQVKDTAPPGTEVEGGWTAPGDGMVDWGSLWPLFETTPSRHLVVEHDNPKDWRATAQRAYDFLIAKGARQGD